MVISCIFPVHCSPTVYKKDAPRKTQVFLRFSRFISVFLDFSKIGFLVRKKDAFGGFRGFE